MADLKPSPSESIPVVVVRRGPRPFEAIDLLDTISHLMDRAFELPGTKVRFGVNSLLLLVPGLGDAVASAVSGLILLIALTHYQVPRVVAARMVLNSLLDAAVSAVPVVGNLWDVWFKADTRNVNLLRQYATLEAGPPPSTWRHWAFVVAALAACLTILALAVAGSVALIVLLVRALQTPAA